MIRVNVQPQMLRWARERAGYSIETLGPRFPKLVNWEAGELQPTLKQLDRFAKATHVPVGFLFLAKPPKERIPIPDFRSVPGARGASPSPNLLDTIYLCQQRQEWFRDFARATGEIPLAFVGSANVRDDVNGTASRMAEVLDFPVEVRRPGRFRTKPWSGGATRWPRNSWFPSARSTPNSDLTNPWRMRSSD